MVPFAGDEAELATLRARLAGLSLGPDDTLVVVDNRPSAVAREPGGAGEPRVVAAIREGSPPHARNVGAAAGSAEWLLFIDADVLAPDDLIDRLFDPPPGDRTAILAGGIVDEAPVGARATPAVRYAHRHRMMDQESTFQHGRWGFAKTANCAVRRRAFEAIGGFQEGIFIGEDADLCYRLAAAGWELDRRDAVAVVHRSRPTIRGLLAQQAAHGAAIGWIDRRYPGSFPQHGWPGLVLWAVRNCGSSLAARLRGDREEPTMGLLHSASILAFELGRRRSNAPRWTRS